MITPPNPPTPSKRSQDFSQKYKTERCRYWYQSGFCPFFQTCAFAHDCLELRDRHALNQNYKTKICHNFRDYGCCRYGDRCQFLHSHKAAQSSANMAQVDPFPSLAFDKLSVSTNEEIESKHQQDLKLLMDFGLDILQAGNRSTIWKCLGESKRSQQSKNERKEWSQGSRQKQEFEQMFPEYNFCKKPRLGSI